MAVPPAPRPFGSSANGHRSKRQHRRPKSTIGRAGSVPRRGASASTDDRPTGMRRKLVGGSEARVVGHQVQRHPDRAATRADCPDDDCASRARCAAASPGVGLSAEGSDECLPRGRIHQARGSAPAVGSHGAAPCRHGLREGTSSPLPGLAAGSIPHATCASANGCGDRYLDWQWR